MQAEALLSHTFPAGEIIELSRVWSPVLQARR